MSNSGGDSKPLVAGLHLSGPLDRPNHRLCFVNRLLVFKLRHGIGYDASAGLHVAVAADGKHGTDGDAGVQIARKVAVDHGPAVVSAASRFKFFNNLHGPPLGRSTERAGREAGAESLDGG